jgi:dipeptidyl aminopeptidase/acylaminoacyl peptidase
LNGGPFTVLENRCMLRIALAAVALIAFFVSLGAEAADKERLTAEKMLLLDRVGNIALSKAGDWIAYTIEVTDPSDFTAHQDTFIAPSSDIKRARRISTGERDVRQIQWAEDGRSLYYLSSGQLWNLSADGGVKRQVSNFPLEVITFRLADHDRLLIAAHDVFPECPDLGCTKTRIEQERGRKDTGRLYQDGEAPRYMENYGDGRYVNLFSATLSETAAVTRSIPITPGYRYDILESAFGLQQDFSVSPDRTWVYFAARPTASNQGDELPKAIYRVDAKAAGKITVIAQDAALSLSSPRVSPDGHRLAYLKTEGTAYTAPRITVHVRDLASGAERRVGGDLDSVLSGLSSNDLQWSSEGDRLYVTGPGQGRVNLFSLPADGTPRFDVLPMDGSVGGYAVGADRVAYIYSRLAQSPEISVVSPVRPLQVLSRSAFQASGSNRFDLGEVERFSFRGWNNELVAGFVMKPAGFDPKRKYPVILQMHGGPNASYSDIWSTGPISPQLLAAAGYAVVLINPHGSSGYGTTFGRSVLGHWGDRPLVDFKAGWAHVLKTYGFIDPNRACAMGSSYGGYLALLFAGRWPEPWKCIFAGSPIFDIRSFFYGTDITAYGKLSFVAEPWNDDSYEQQSPLTYVSNWKVPLFIVGGTNDYRVPHDQNISAYGAARLMKVPAQIMVFEGESHGVRKPHNVVRLFQETNRWLDRWTAPEPSVPRDH